MGEQELMDCQQIMEVLDGYALGAADPEESRHVEQHVADCIRCWEELTKAQQTAALLTLSVPLHTAPSRLGERVIAAAQREKAGVRQVEDSTPFWRRLRLGWPVASGGLAATSAAAIVFAAFLQVQVSDLKNENTELRSVMRSSTFAMERQLAQADSKLADQQTLTAVLSDNNKQAIHVASSSRSVKASANYTYSPAAKLGIFECVNMPGLPPGQVYQIWVTAGGDSHAVMTVTPQDGWCQAPMDVGFIDGDLEGIGISVENVPGGIEKPANGWLLYAHFDD